MVVGDRRAGRNKGPGLSPAQVPHARGGSPVCYGPADAPVGQGDEMSESQRQAVKSANRVLDLFELLGTWGDALSHTQIAAALKIPKSSLSQLLPNMLERGYIEYVPSSRGYKLGSKLATLANQVSQTRNLEKIILPILQDITDKAGESSALNVLRGDESEVAVSVSSPKRLVSHMRVGDLAPLYATSGGKVVLTFLPEMMAEDYLSRVVFEKITDKTISSIEQLREEMEVIRRDGVAYSFEEFTPGIIGMATPILSSSGRPLGSINVAMPAVRYNEEMRATIVDLLKDGARNAMQRLGVVKPG